MDEKELNQTEEGQAASAETEAAATATPAEAGAASAGASEGESGATSEAAQDAGAQEPAGGAKAGAQAQPASGKRQLLFGGIGAGFVLAACIVAVVLGLGGKPAAKEWVSNYDTALAAAKERKKDMLVVFMGTEWDGVSPELCESILDTSEFIAAAGKEYELCKLDIPLDDSVLSDEEIDDLYALASMFGLDSLPSFILLDSEGTPYATIPYTEDLTSQEALLERFNEAREMRANAQKLWAKLEKAKGADRVKVIDELYETLPAEQQGELLQYIREVPQLDPDNATGLLGKFSLMLAYADAGEAMQLGEVERAVSIFTDLAEGDLLSPEFKQEAYYTAAYIFFVTNQITSNAKRDEVVEIMQKAADALPGNEIALSVAQTIEALKAEDIDALMAETMMMLE